MSDEKAFVRKQLYLLWIVTLCNAVAIGLL